MATIVQPPQTDKEQDRSRLSDSGHGGWRNLVPADGDLRLLKDRPSPAASTGIWVALAAISMSFAALTSAFVVRKGASSDWQQFTLPAILYLNTLVLVASRLLEIFTPRGVHTQSFGLDKMGNRCCDSRLP